MLRLVRWLVRQDEHRPPVVIGVLVGHPLADLVGTPADEHGTSGLHDLRKRVLCEELEEPSHRVVGASDEAVQRHRPVHHDLAQTSLCVAHTGDDPTQVTKSSASMKQSGGPSFTRLDRSPESWG